MSDQLWVDPTDLLLSGSRMAHQADDLLIAHTAAIAQVERERTGWVGTSGSMLGELVESWREFSSEVHRKLVKNAERFDAAGRQYLGVDAAAARDTSRDGATSSLNLN